MLALSQDTQAALLLCANLGQRDPLLRPLTARQYGVVAKWLLENALRPGDLLRESGRSRLGEFKSGDLSGESLSLLLERGAALGLMTERWASKGIWVIGRADSAYPARLKTYLQHSAPPVFFGVGEQGILQKSGVAIVGSRNAAEEDLAFARRLGRECATQRLIVISGGAKGIDSEAMMSSVDHGGTSLGVLAEGIARTSIAAKYHDAITDGRLALISAYEPESRWFAYNAMERNKLIYGLSEAAVVVSSSIEKGGTWSGAVEALKHQRVSVYVNITGAAPEGNRKLLQIGAREFPTEAWNNLDNLIGNSPAVAPLFEQVSKESSVSGESPTNVDHVSSPGIQVDESSTQSPHSSEESYSSERKPTVSGTQSGLTMNSTDSYERIEKLLLQVLEIPCNEKDVAVRLNIVPAQAKAWLIRAVEEGRVRKLKKPTRYQSLKSSKLF